MLFAIDSLQNLTSPLQYVSAKAERVFTARKPQFSRIVTQPHSIYAVSLATNIVIKTRDPDFYVGKEGGPQNLDSVFTIYHFNETDPPQDRPPSICTLSSERDAHLEYLHGDIVDIEACIAASTFNELQEESDLFPSVLWSLYARSDVDRKWRR